MDTGAAGLCGDGVCYDHFAFSFRHPLHTAARIFAAPSVRFT